MSQWTHILGVIRFENIGQNIYPQRPGFDPGEARGFVEKVFKEGPLPGGSEGPIELNIVVTERGPAVLIAGDLRDFGEKDLGIILQWTTKCVNLCRKTSQKKLGVPLPIILRDGFIFCDVESCEDEYIIKPTQFDDERRRYFALFKNGKEWETNFTSVDGKKEQDITTSGKK